MARKRGRKGSAGTKGAVVKSPFTATFGMKGRGKGRKSGRK